MTHVLFAGHCYYPQGGISDLVARGSVDELKSYFQNNAKKIARGNYIDLWAQIVRSDTLECVLWGELSHVAGNLSETVEPEWHETPPE